MRKLIALVFQCLFFTSICWGHDYSQWRFWSVRDGLAASRSKDIAIGKDKFLWINNGINLYMSSFDGFDFQIMENPTQQTRPTKAGYNHDLWLMYSTGLFHFQDQQWQHYMIEESQKCSTFWPLNEDQLILVSKKVLYLFDIPTQTCTPIMESTLTSIGDFLDCVGPSKNALWISGRNGFAKLGLQNDQQQNPLIWQEYPYINEDYKYFRSINLTPDGNVIAVANTNDDDRNAIVGLQNEEWVIHYEGEAPISEAWISFDGYLWYHNSTNVFWVDNDEVKQISRTGPLAGEIYDAEPDEDGLFWLATSEGIAHYTPSIWSSPLSVKHIQSWVHAIREDQHGRIWYLSKTILICNDHGNWKFYPLPDGETSHRYETEDLCLLSDGRLVFNTEHFSRFLIFDPETESFEFITHPEEVGIRIMSPSRDGNVWCRMQQRGSHVFYIAKFNGVDFTPYLLNSGEVPQLERIRTIYESKDGDLWAGCLTSVAHIQDGNLTVWNASNGFPGSCGLFIYEALDGEIWVGDRNQILIYKNNDWSIKKSEIDAVRSIMRDDQDNVWVATDGGLYRYSSDGTWVLIDHNDGLISEIVYRVYQDSRSRIWLGTALGISLYHPKYDNDAPITIINPDKNPKNISSEGKARFVFSGIDKWKYTESHRLLFSVRLNNEDWLPFTTETIASFDNLKHGEHTFSVRSMDRNFNIETTPSQYTFFVKLPWYQESGFLAITTACLLTIMVLIITLISRYMKLELLVRKRTESLNHAYNQLELDAIELSIAEEKLRSMSSELILTEERERRRIATLLHDGIGHVLALSKLKLGQLKKQSSHPNHRLIQEILDYTDQTLDQTHSLLFELSPPVLYELGFERALQWLIEEFKVHNHQEIELSTNGNSLPLPEDTRVMLFQFTRELLVNALKHSQAQKILISYYHNNNQIILKVQDNGIGMNGNSTNNKSYGLFSIRQRLKYINGTLDIQSKSNQGTTITIQIPTKDAMVKSHEYTTRY